MAYNTEQDEFNEDEVIEAKITKDDVFSQLSITTDRIKEYANMMDVNEEKSMKRIFNYLNWIDIKTNFINNENRLNIPESIIPNSVNSYLFKNLYQENKQLIEKYYTRKDISNNDFVYVLNNNVINNDDIIKLINLLIIKRTNVVWIEFGFNIGKEFGGKHPALILKNIGDNIIVAPLSSKAPKEIKDFHVKVNNVFDFSKKKVRWINIHRIIPVSKNRIDFNSEIGNVRGEVLKAISIAINLCGVK
jgi:mRNA-degrading endonuclease toxin of MazEF toxin-antitoxin module